MLGDELLSLCCAHTRGEGCYRVRARVIWGCVVPGRISDDDAILLLGYHSRKEAVSLSLCEMGGFQFCEYGPEEKIWKRTSKRQKMSKKPKMYLLLSVTKLPLIDGDRNIKMRLHHLSLSLFYTQTYTYTHLHTHIHTVTHTYTYTHTRTHLHTHTHTHPSDRSAFPSGSDPHLVSREKKDKKMLSKKLSDQSDKFEPLQNKSTKSKQV